MFNILVTSRARTLGLNHPNNENGWEFFSNAQYFDVYDKDWKKLGGFNIDERGFNTFSGMSHNKKLNDWLYAQHKDMKASDPEYGSYDSTNRDNKLEGKKHLYAHDFMLWLKDHQLQLAK